MSKQWSASKYRANRQKRQESTKPEWATNPETGESFFLRRVDLFAEVLEGYLPSNLTADAVMAWRETGVGGDSPLPEISKEDGEKNLARMARIIQESCVLPKIVLEPKGDDEIALKELDGKDAIFISRWATGQIGNVEVGGKVMDMTKLKSVPKKPGLRARAGNDGAQLQQVAQ